MISSDRITVMPTTENSKYALELQPSVNLNNKINGIYTSNALSYTPATNTLNLQNVYVNSYSPSSLVQMQTYTYTGLFSSALHNGLGNPTAYTASITGTTVTITGTVNVSWAPGMVLTGNNVSPGTYIVSGSYLTWTVNQSQSVTSTSITGTGYIGLTGIDTPLTINIKPKYSNSKILINVKGTPAVNYNLETWQGIIKRTSLNSLNAYSPGTNASGISGYWSMCVYANTASGDVYPFNFDWLDSPNTTNLLTYTLRIAGNQNWMTGVQYAVGIGSGDLGAGYNIWGGICSITAMEIAQ